jgi:hypothetical protein
MIMIMIMIMIVIVIMMGRRRTGTRYARMRRRLETCAAGQLLKANDRSCQHATIGRDTSDRYGGAGRDASVFFRGRRGGT